MYVILTCHTEVDRANQYGNAKENPLEDQSFNHIPVLLSLLAKYEIPITFSLMVGGQAGLRLLEFISKEKAKFPSKSELSIHFHFEQYNETKEIWESSKITEEKILGGHSSFCETLGTKPKSAVFGHWVANEEALRLMKEIGIKVDGSYAPYRQNERFITKSPFEWMGILEVPVVSDGIYPLNPVQSLYHLELLKQIIKRYHAEEIVLHLGFHSYDFFDFSDGKISVKTENVEAFEGLISTVKKYKLKLLNLSDALKYDFDSYTISDIQLRMKLRLYISLLRKRRDK